MNPYTYADAHAKLVAIQEEDLLNAWNTLTEGQQKNLLQEIKTLDVDIFKRQQALQRRLKPKKEMLATSWEPYSDYFHAGSKSNQTLGKELITQGKVGCLLVAGGQGTRLSYDAPKGTFPVSVIKKKSLFQIFAEKTIAAGNQVKQKLPLAIMTSPLNHEAILNFFNENNYFGLDKEQIFFFMQGELPFLDNQGHLLLINKQSIAKGPDGNGNSLSLFIQSGIWETWKKRGIEYINYILIDNPLADPFDAELIGFHANEKNDITVKCVERHVPDERVGLLVKTDAGVAIVEYNEMSTSERYAMLSEGKLKHICTNISLFCFSMAFIKKSLKNALPWHLTSKPAYINGPLAWKFETFIFDYLAFTKSVKALLYPREEAFAPLKNEFGNDSLETVQKALIKQDISILKQICRHPIPFCPIELDQQFHYPTEDLLAKWKGYAGPFQGYFNP